jgi:glycosyltransferase involved in cell wall biosynthesis
VAAVLLKGRDETEDSVILKKTRLIALLNSYSEGLSGSDLRFIEIAKRITDKKTQLIVVTSRLGKELCVKKGLKASFKVTSNENKFSHIILTYAMRIFSTIFHNFGAKEDTVLYATSDFLPDVFPIYFFKLRNKNVRWIQTIHHIQGNPFVRVGKSLFVNFLGFFSQKMSLILIKKRADIVVVMNTLIKKQLLDAGFSENRIHINCNGVNFDDIKAFTPSVLKYDGVFLGRLNVSKGIFDLVKVWSYVVAKNPNAKLAIIGKGDKQIEKGLWDYAASLNITKNIDFLGYLSDSNAFGILKSAKVFIFPSYEEGFGIAILEAMACGLPVVTYNLPVYREIFEDKLTSVPAGLTAVMARRVCFLLENPEVARVIATTGMSIVEKYDWDKIAERELRLIKNI